MSLFDPKTKEQCKTALDTTLNHCKNAFQIELDLAHLSAKLAQLKQEKLDDYLLQRFKDWTIADLSLCMQVIQEHGKPKPVEPQMKTSAVVVENTQIKEKSEKKRKL